MSNEQKESKDNIQPDEKINVDKKSNVNEKDLKSQTKKEEQTSQNDKNEVVLSQEEFDGIKVQMAKILNDYKELEKDFEHYRKRTREEEVLLKRDGMVKALETILPSLDSFKKAKKLISDEKVLEGINMIEKSIISSLEKIGVKKIECINKKFDPEKHNAVLMVEDKNFKSGHIIEELEAGYTLEDTIIKYSQVIVAK